MKMLAKLKKNVSNVKDSCAEWSSEMKHSVVMFIIDSGKSDEK